MRARRQDSNHKAIREAFRKLGASWVDTHALGNGFPDGLVGFGGLSIAVEIKDPLKPPSARRLTPKEQDFHANWTGGVRVVQDEQDVRQLVAQLEKWRDWIYRGIAEELKSINNQYFDNLTLTG